MKRYTITLELDFETDSDPIDRAKEIMQRTLRWSSADTDVPSPGVKAEHYHLDSKSLRCIDE